MYTYPDADRTVPRRVGAVFLRQSAGDNHPPRMSDTGVSALHSQVLPATSRHAKERGPLCAHRVAPAAYGSTSIFDVPCASRTSLLLHGVYGSVDLLTEGGDRRMDENPSSDRDRISLLPSRIHRPQTGSGHFDKPPSQLPVAAAQCEAFHKTDGLHRRKEEVIHFILKLTQNGGLHLR